MHGALGCIQCWVGHYSLALWVFVPDLKSATSEPCTGRVAQSPWTQDFAVNVVGLELSHDPQAHLGAAVPPQPDSSLLTTYLLVFLKTM